MRQTSVESYLRTIKKDLEENSLLLSKEIDDATRDSIKHFVFSTLNALRSCVEYSYQDVIDLVIEPNVLPHVDEKLKKEA